MTHLSPGHLPPAMVNSVTESKSVTSQWELGGHLLPQPTCPCYRHVTHEGGAPSAAWGALGRWEDFCFWTNTPSHYLPHVALIWLTLWLRTSPLSPTVFSSMAPFPWLGFRGRWIDPYKMREDQRRQSSLKNHFKMMTGNKSGTEKKRWPEQRPMGGPRMYVQFWDRSGSKMWHRIFWGVDKHSVKPIYRGHELKHKTAKLVLYNKTITVKKFF